MIAPHQVCTRMRLLTSNYRDPDPARQAELLACLERNGIHHFIAAAQVLIEEPGASAAYPELALAGVRPVASSRRQARPPDRETSAAVALRRDGKTVQQLRALTVIPTAGRKLQ